MEKAEKLIQKYSENLPLRLLVQTLIPYVGGSIDTVLTALNEKGSKWRQERIETLIEDFGQQINSLIEENDVLQAKVKEKIDKEDFYDLFLSCLQKTILTGNKDKIKLFSNILCNYCIHEDALDDAELIVNVINDLSIKEMLIIKNVKDNENKIEFDNIDNVFVEFDKAKLYCQNNKISNFNVQNLPEEFKFENDTIFLYDRLERSLILKKYEKDRRNLSYSYSRPNGATIQDVVSEKYICYVISDFGLKIISWMFLNLNTGMN